MENASKRNSHFQLNDTILSIIESYIDTMMRQVRGLYSLFVYNDIKHLLPTYLRFMSTLENDDFFEMVKEDFDINRQSVQVILALNVMMKSKDVEILRLDRGIYRDMLNGRICKRPANNQEAFDIIHAIQEVLIQNFNKIVDDLLATKYQAEVVGESRNTEI